ncbi:PREDICTED: tetratricopeptide repeat protein 37 [Nicrophorus vespilloides]|uniref:Tetratricopeptide repeat protein 37 n=1 Tax=Nicrophorus vespilloides TaxID=110193 RepID=A0ABM1NER4_NICVS|nr:PREDICTED: tetratricopeptide repeat protein 37 [Nicrophorus vespilloides]
MDIKSNLKDARDAIKNKDFEKSMKLCKSILREDKTNYMGLVFLGISLQEVGPIEQAPNAFRKAIQQNATNILAWNGLLNFYEKVNNPQKNKDLIGIYCKLIELETNETKCIEIVQKFVDLQVDDMDHKVVSIYNVANCDTVTVDLKLKIYASIVEVYRDIKDPQDIVKQIFEKCLLELIESGKASKEVYIEYLKFLYNNKKYENFMEEADKFTIMHGNNIHCFEWVCKVFNELYIERNSLYEKYLENVKICLEELLELHSDSSIALLTKAIMFCIEDNLDEMKSYLHKVTLLRPGLLHAWILYTECFIKFHFYEDALEVAYKADKLLLSINNSKQSLRNILDNYMCLCLSQSNIPEELEKCKVMCLKILENSDEVMIKKYLIEAYVKLEYWEKAEKCIDSCDEDIKPLLLAKLFRAKGFLKKALGQLENFTLNSSEYWLELGEVYRDSEMYEKCLVPFLKAAKLDPNSYMCFLHLGEYYNKINDMDKARRCYEKCFKINGKCSAAGIELSKIYRKQKMWGENLNLLENLASVRASRDNKWAYLQLGLHFLEQEDYPNAITNFRYVVRVDSTNSHCWECLADAYLARGAYTSAIKCYQKAFEIKPDSLYALLQVAHIKKVLNEYEEARSVFENVLNFNKNYVPALKGIAETCYYQGKNYHRQQLHGLARDCVQYSIDKITVALKERPDLSCLWKIAADSSYLAAQLPEKYSCIMALSKLVSGSDGDMNTVIDQEDLFKFAIRCYCKAINLTEDNMLIYHDLSCCYVSYSMYLTQAKERQEYLDKALQVIYHCVNSNPNYWQHWNVLGNIAFVKDPKDLALAQHAFIKAVTLEHNSAVSWSNLGTLYLYIGELKLANEAFSQAQRGDPNYVNSWIGQALIAESLGYNDSMDLFRHSTQLSAHQQGALGYAYWVCKTLMDAPEDAVIYSIHNMHAIPVACDALTWYTDKNPFDSCAWNMLGILYERMGLKSNACKAFKKALQFSSLKNMDSINTNYGRSLLNIDKPEESVNAYRDVHEATFNSGSGLALALFKDKKYQESYEAYESALHWLTEDEGYQSDLLVALASMAYLFQGPDEAKTLLLQSTQLKQRSPWGLYATLSLGLLHNDLNLSLLVLNEMDELIDNKQALPHYGLLLSYIHLLQGETTKAIRELTKLVHRHPDQASLWLSLSVLLLRLHDEKPVSQSAAKCAEVAMALGQTKMDVTKVLCIVSLASLFAGDLDKGLVAAQRAIHIYPNVAEGWAVLIFALHLLKKKMSKNFNVENLRKNVSFSKNLSDWISNVKI